MKSSNTWLACLLCVGVAATAARPAVAQTAGVMKQDAASSGKTDVASAGFQTTEKPADAKEASELKISAGGLMATGNARSLALTGSGNLRLRRAANEYSAAFAGNYARGAASAAEPTETTVENLQGKVRYDRFLSDEWSLFAAETARKDRFQGLDLRLNFDPGVAYYFFDIDKHRLWAELGYDLQYDIRNDDAIAAAPEPVSKTEVRHSARAFIGYKNDLNEAVRFNTGLEYLQDVIDTENWRLNWQAGLTSAIAGNFSLATTFNLSYDHNPLPGVENTDTTTALSLVYTLL